jgi:hypothetical protein
MLPLLRPNQLMLWIFNMTRCETVLGEFLREIIKNPSVVDYSSTINILIAHSQTKDSLLQVECSFNWVYYVRNVCSVLKSTTILIRLILRILWFSIVDSNYMDKRVCHIGWQWNASELCFRNPVCRPALSFLRWWTQKKYGHRILILDLVVNKKFKLKFGFVL